MFMTLNSDSNYQYCIAPTPRHTHWRESKNYWCQNVSLSVCLTKWPLLLVMNRSVRYFQNIKNAAQQSVVRDVCKQWGHLYFLGHNFLFWVLWTLQSEREKKSSYKGIRKGSEKWKIVKTQRNSTQLNSTQSNCKSNFVGLEIVLTWNPPHPPP